MRILYGVHGYGRGHRRNRLQPPASSPRWPGPRLSVQHGNGRQPVASIAGGDLASSGDAGAAGLGRCLSGVLGGVRGDAQRPLLGGPDRHPVVGGAESSRPLPPESSGEPKFRVTGRIHCSRNAIEYPHDDFSRRALETRSGGFPSCHPGGIPPEFRAWRCPMTREADSAGSVSQASHRSATDSGEVSAAPAVPDDLHALRAVVEGTAAGIGQEFFRSLVRHLAEAIAVPYATVCEFQTPPHGRVLAIWERDHVAEDFLFQFTTSPAAEVLSSDLVHFPTGVLQRFPQARFLAERSIEGYMAVPLQAGAGNVLGFLSIFDDRPMPAEPRRLFILRIFAARATAELQRIRAEQRLGESEARYRDLFDNAPNAYWLVGTDGRVLHANRRAAELLGRPLEEMVGAPTPSFGADTPEGKPRILEVRRKHLAGESVSGWELELRRKDGRPAWVKVWMEPGRGADGAIGAPRAFGVDITDRVLAERERARLQAQNLYLQ